MIQTNPMKEQRDVHNESSKHSDGLHGLLKVTQSLAYEGWGGSPLTADLYSRSMRRMRRLKPRESLDALAIGSQADESVSLVCLT